MLYRAVVYRFRVEYTHALYSQEDLGTQLQRVLPSIKLSRNGYNLARAGRIS